MRYVLATLCIVGGVACGGHGGPAAFPASNAPYGKPMLLSLPPCAQSVEVAVVDYRANPTVIGQRYEESAPTVRYPIQMQGDTATYVRYALTVRLQQAGANAPNTSHASLLVQIGQLMLDEKVFYNSEYSAQSSFQATLQAAGAAQPCWQRIVTATATNYGTAASTVNYQETLDRLMDAAATELVKAPGFAEAMCGQCSAVLAPPLTH